MAQQLQNNTVYLTDDFVQALNSTKPATITKFMLLDLPAWHDAEGYMFINSAELGLTETSPNILLPAMFEQYWFNLCAYARKLHAEVETGDVVEDFAEQAFWKTIVRLTDFSNEYLQSVVVFESDNVIVNTNSVDGVNFLQIVLSIAAQSKQQNFQFDASKPSYLYTQDKVPSTTVPQTITGNLTAVYDKNLSYYDLASNLCLQARKDSELGTQLMYNAVLLFYDNAGVKQVAGIYFPNAFVQSDNNVWVLPTVQPAENTTIGYEINIAINAVGAVNYIASNPSLSQGNLAFAQMYKKMQSANLQLAEFANKIARLELQMQGITALINQYSFANIQRQLEQFKAQLTTHFGGAISTDKLLDMFIAAKQSTGTLNLSMHMSDLSKPVLGQQITVHGQGIGQYNDGDVIELGTSYSEIIRKMLDNRRLDPYIQPVAKSMLEEVAINFVDISEFGSLISTRHQWVQNDAGEIVNRVLQRYIANHVTEYLEVASSNDVIDILNEYETEGVMRNGFEVATLQKIIQTCQYNEGEEHYYSDETPIPGRIQAGSIISQFYIRPKNYVIILHEDASTTIESIAASFANMTYQKFDAMTVPTDALSVYNPPTNVVSYIIQVADINANSGRPAYAELGLDFSNVEDYDSNNADVNKQGIMLQGNVKRYARIVRIEHWNGIFDLSHVQPTMI